MKRVMGVIVGIIVLVALTGAVLIESIGSTFSGQAASAAAVVPSTTAVKGIPTNVLTLYLQDCHDIWAICAGIGKVESDHGRSQLAGVHSGANAFGAEGPMQFEPATWVGSGKGCIVDSSTMRDPAFIAKCGGYGTDGDGDGISDIYNLADAIPSTYKLLKADGVDSNQSKAIYAYNHDWGYVQNVLDLAKAYSTIDVTAITNGSSGLVTPAPPGGTVVPAAPVVVVPPVSNPNGELVTSNGYLAAPGQTAGVVGLKIGGLLTALYTLPVDRNLVTEDMLTQLHHDYPADDIGVGTGSNIYSVTAGTVIAVSHGGSCGDGVRINGNDNYTYQYCHGEKVLVRNGQKVGTGAEIMISDSSGDATGPHLHIEVLNSQKRDLCPQSLMVAWYQGRISEGPTPSLPSTGCFSSKH